MLSFPEVNELSDDVRKVFEELDRLQAHIGETRRVRTQRIASAKVSGNPFAAVAARATPAARRARRESVVIPSVDHTRPGALLRFFRP